MASRLPTSHHSPTVLARSEPRGATDGQATDTTSRKQGKSGGSVCTCELSLGFVDTYQRMPP